jgi:hypothetical protein
VLTQLQQLLKVLQRTSLASHLSLVPAPPRLISFSFNWAATLLVSITFLSLIRHLGNSLTYWLYALLALAAMIFCWFLVPQTQGKSLEQIEQYWENGRQW